MSRQPASSYFDPAGLGLIALLWQWRRFLVINLLVVMVLAAGVTLLLPNWYRAKATILPPRDESPMLSRGAMDLLVGLGPIGFAGAGLTATGSQQLVAVLRSRSLADVVIEREGLVEHYGFDTLPKARREFFEDFSVSTDPDGLVNIRLADLDRHKSAAILNTALEVLDSINQSLSNSNAAATSRFVKSRLDDVEANLRRAENEMRVFQEQHGTIAIEEQLAVMIQNLAALRVERMQQHMELSILEERLGPNHIRLTSERQKLARLDRQIRTAEMTGDSAASLTAGNAPRLVLESLRLLRQVTIYDQIYQFLRQSLEQARIDEQRDIPTFTVLDPAIPPDRKWRPRRTFLVLGSGAVAFALFAALIVWSESTRPTRDTPPVNYKDGWQRLGRRRREPVEEGIG